MNRQAKIGLVLLTAIVLAYLTISWIRNSGFFARGSKEYHVFFENVNGLKIGDPVTVFGYEAGSVSSFEQQTEGMLVTVAINEQTKLYSDATAELVIKEILGGKQIAMQPGKSGKTLEIGQTIKGKPTFDLTVAMQQFGRFLDQTDPQTIKRMVDNIDKLTTQLAELDLASTLSRVQQTLARFEQTAANADRLLQAAQRDSLISTMASLMNRFKELSADASLTMKNINGLTSGADSLLPEFRFTLRQTQSALAKGDSLAARLLATMDQLKKQPSVANALLHDPKLLADMNQALEELYKTFAMVRAGGLRVGVRLNGAKKAGEPFRK